MLTSLRGQSWQVLLPLLPRQRPAQQSALLEQEVPSGSQVTAQAESSAQSPSEQSETPSQSLSAPSVHSRNSVVGGAPQSSEQEQGDSVGS